MPCFVSDDLCIPSEFYAILSVSIKNVSSIFGLFFECVIYYNQQVFNEANDYDVSNDYVHIVYMYVQFLLL